MVVQEELETLLNDSGNLRTLAFLYASKGMSSKALAIWRILARNYSSGHWEDRSGEMDSQHFSTNLSSSKKIAAFEASKILEKSSDQDLVLQHLGWIADIDQALAVRILTSERNDQLSPGRLYNGRLSTDLILGIVCEKWLSSGLNPRPQASITDEVIAAIDPKKVEILQSYLQWLIEDQDFEDTQFHTTYALLLAKSAIETFDNLSQNSEARTLEETSMSVMGRNSIFQSPIRERLQIFLQSSELYDPEEVLDLIEESELWLEKAILYKKLGQETLVLQILALLLEMYLDPKDGKEPMFKAAVRLLHNHGESLDPLQVLEIDFPPLLNEEKHCKQ
ncbi:vacuolar sorting protein 39 [Actinidia rufa]|uniref:Vacuolar sorting protein 39 n=1 Tax=Actinidia rufa TaxID=165716 RepID=A0A7J0FSA1_9ERIC|nr:vacuolar sorting protein 39 [Actinidia rufa]